MGEHLFQIWLESKPARKIVLLGKTGEGKSSCGNTILKKQIFTTESGPESVTAKGEAGVGMVGGRKVTVIDTPGIFDTRQDEESLKSEIIKCIVESAPAVDAYVIVLKVERYTKQEEETVDKIIEYCGDNNFNNNAVVLFTHGEQLNGQTIEEFVKKSPKLQELVDKCGGRCHVIDNKYWRKRWWGQKSNRVQVEKLMKTIDEMVEKNGCYRNKVLQKLEEVIQAEMMNNIEDHLLTEEKREAAKKIVLQRFVIRLAGATTGIVTGAFLGVGVAVASVVALLKAAKLTRTFKAIATTVTAASTLADKSPVAAAAGGAVSVCAVAGVAGAVAVEAGVAAGGAAAAAGMIAVEGVVAGAGIGAAAGAGIAAGVIVGAAALAGGIGGGITGYRATEEADSVLDAIKMAAKDNYNNAKSVVKKAEQLPSNVYKKLH